MTKSAHQPPDFGDELGKLQSVILRRFDELSGQFGLSATPDDLLEQHDDRILHALNDVEDHVRSGVLSQLTSLTQTVESLANTVAILTHQQQCIMTWGHVTPVVPSGPFQHRLLGDNVFEKIEVSKYVVDKFFVNRASKQLCFVQASSMAYYLFGEVDRNPRVPSYCLFHVNGPIAPLPLQFGRSNGKHSIVPFWGSIFDTSCAAYLPPSGDREAVAELRDLFLRSDEPLNTVYLTPRFITPDGRVYYERLESVHFVDAIADAMASREGTEIVVLATGDRVMPSVSFVPANIQNLVALESVLADHRDKLKYVVSSPNYPLPQHAQELRQCVGELHWQTSGPNWVQ